MELASQIENMSWAFDSHYQIALQKGYTYINSPRLMKVIYNLKGGKDPHLHHPPLKGEVFLY